MNRTQTLLGIVAALLIVGLVPAAVAAPSDRARGNPFHDGGLSAQVQGAGQDKVTICHVPPGNPSNAHTIRVGAPAVAAHLAHGDSLGACAGEAELPEEEKPKHEKPKKPKKPHFPGEGEQPEEEFGDSIAIAVQKAFSNIEQDCDVRATDGGKATCEQEANSNIEQDANVDADNGGTAIAVQKAFSNIEQDADVKADDGGTAKADQEANSNIEQNADVSAG